MSLKLNQLLEQYMYGESYGNDPALRNLVLDLLNYNELIRETLNLF